MKQYLVMGLAVCAATLLGSCKSKESAYRQAYEKAKAQQANQANDETTTIQVTPTTGNDGQKGVSVTPVTSDNKPAGNEDNSDVRTINGTLSVISGEQLRTYSVVVGSFTLQANADGLYGQLKNKGYAARVVKTNETINGHTGWFRVVASSYDDKASAVRSRGELKGTYPGAWLLFHK